jgi:sirohydrochlorin cobaltochelatase
MNGVVLFAHGARDPRWAEPFERVRAVVVAQRPTTPVALAYLELMEPDLDGAIDRLVAAGCGAVTIVPLFLGQGSHLRRDLPARVDAVRARLPSIALRVADAAGDDATVVAALADYCLRSASAAG